MTRILSAFVVLFISATIAVSTYQGRSADLLYTPSNIQDDSFLFLMDKYSGSANEQLSESNVADFISYLIGTPILNPSASRENFPQVNIFEKDRANVLIVVDGVGADMVDSLQLKTLQQKGQRFNIVKEFYPQDNVASLTTMFTGYGPEVHGIVNKTWISDEEGKVLAYSNLYSSTQVVNVADVVSSTFNGRSLIVSASADAQIASIFAVNRFANQLAENAYSYHYCEKSGAFKNVREASIANVPSTHDDLINAIASQVYPMRNKADSIKFSADTNEVAVSMPADNVHTKFDLSTKEDLMFFSEIVLAQSIVSSLNDVNTIALVNDANPDLFTFAFSSVKALERLYGSDSAQVKAAVLILDGVIAKLAADLKTLYGRVAVEVAFMGVPAYTRIQHSAEFQQFKTDVYNALKPNTMHINTFPAVYVQGVKAETACQSLKNQGLGAFRTVELQCPTVRQVSQDDPSVDPYPSYAEFQIVLWGSILLGLTLFSTIYALYNMDTGSDSFLRAAPMVPKK